jgi:hypothetical protein
MQPLTLRQVSVWLDDWSPEGVAFAHALQWASRLRLPIRAIIPSRGTCTTPRLRDREKDPATVGVPLECALLTDRLDVLAAACESRSVAWDASLWHGSVALGVDLFVRPGELCVVGQDMQPGIKGAILQRSLHSPETAVLVCSRFSQAFSRVLILHEHCDRGNQFLDHAAQFCRVLQVAPVILTVARSRSAEQRCRQFAGKVLGRYQLAAEHDFMTGCDARTAVACMSRWRRCSHVVVEKRESPLWRRWLRKETMERVLGLSESLTIVGLPGALSLEGGEALPPFLAEESTN